MWKLPRTNSRSQPTARVGKLKWGGRDIGPSFIASGQPLLRVGNLARRRCDVIPDSMGSGLRTLLNASGSSQTRTFPCSQTSPRSPSPSPNQNSVQSKPPKRPRRRTIQTREFIKPTKEPDGQALQETVYFSVHSSEEYQSPYNPVETDSESDIDRETLNIAKDTASRRCELPLAANKSWMTLRISTTSGSQEVGLINRTLAAHGRIIRGRPYSPPTFLSSGVGQYSSLLGPHGATASGVTNSGPVGDPDTP